jgi:hypothetical protein
MVDSLFQVHKLNNAGLDKAYEIAAAFDALVNRLAPICPAGRELAIVRTKLEEAAFFAKKAMANVQENQQ